MRSTIHLVTADDALALRPLCQEVLDREVRTHGEWRDLLREVDAGAVTAFAGALLDEAPRTQPQLKALLAERFPQWAPGPWPCCAATPWRWCRCRPGVCGARRRRSPWPPRRRGSGGPRRRRGGRRRPALPGRLRAGHGGRRRQLVGAPGHARGRRPPAPPAAGLHRRAGPSLRRPARRPPSRPGHARAGAVPAGVRQRPAVARRPQPVPVRRASGGRSRPAPRRGARCWSTGAAWARGAWTRTARRARR